MRLQMLLVVVICLGGALPLAVQAQEFKGDVKVDEVGIIMEFDPLGMVNQNKIREVWQHVERVKIGERVEPIYGDQLGLYAYLPHRVHKRDRLVDYEKKLVPDPTKPIYEDEWVVDEDVGVVTSLPGSAAELPLAKGSTVMVAVSTARVRSRPTTRSSTVRVVQKGARLTKVGRQGGWIRVRLDDGRTGYISGELLR